MKRLLARLTSYQLKAPEELDTELNKAFDRAKRVSDYVGMIVRLAFCAYATQFFWSQAKTTAGIQSWALGVSGVTAFCLQIWFGAQIILLITLHSLSDVTQPRIGLAFASPTLS
jgi:hypothetical protein